MTALHFDEALVQAAREVAGLPTEGVQPVRLVRDLYGRLRFAVDCPEDELPENLASALRTASSRLGRYSASARPLTRDSFSDPDAFFDSPDWHQTVVPQPPDDDGNPQPDLQVLLLDRQIVGQDWLRGRRRERQEGEPPRVVFYGLKGGVGRSTALAMLAYLLARQGRKVLLVDFDLESPGLSGLLLPQEKMAAFGLVDWFIEDGVGGDVEAVMRDLVVDSPLSEHTSGRIRVAAALGQAETDYLAKLSRIYGDVPSPQGPQRFAQRMERVVRALETQERPDIVLIDSRAGLHDLAAVSITALADLALLFAIDSRQNWEGYRQLFRHWQLRPQVLRGVRERVWMVRAMQPESDQIARFQRFLEASHGLFSRTLYDEVVPAKEDGGEQAQGEAAFNYGLDDEDGPHHPLTVRWSPRFTEFDPLAADNRGGTSDTDIDLAFGPFAQKVVALVFGD